MASVRKDEGDECVNHGWYDPSDDRPMGSVCAIEGCGLPSAFNLCPKHALPGMVVEVGNPGPKVVISSWVVERKGQHYVVLLNDFTLGRLFRNREQFEEELVREGCAILHFAFNEKDVDIFKLSYPDLRAFPWTMMARTAAASESNT